MISIRNLKKSYSQTVVLDNVNLEIPKGSCTVIIGSSGCGKSTLLKTLVKLNEHSSGEIIVDDESIDKLDSAALAQRVAYLPQNKRTPDIGVLRMVLHGRFAYLKYPRRYRKEDYDMARKALQWVGIENLAEIFKEIELFESRDDYFMEEIEDEEVEEENTSPENNTSSDTPSSESTPSDTPETE